MILQLWENWITIKIRVTRNPLKRRRNNLNFFVCCILHSNINFNLLKHKKYNNFKNIYFRFFCWTIFSFENNFYFLYFNLSFCPFFAFKNSRIHCNFQEEKINCLVRYLKWQKLIVIILVLYFHQIRVFGFELCFLTCFWFQVKKNVLTTAKITKNKFRLLL